MSEEKTCVFCGNTETFYEEIPKQQGYRRCPKCSGVFMVPKFYLSAEKEKERYELHNNTLEDPRYRAYLEGFLESVLKVEAVEKAEISGERHSRVLDFGSGPNPALVTILNEKGFAARGWDLYFQQDDAVLKEKYPLVTCLEVVEHFKCPKEGFSQLAACVEDGGFAAIGTHFVPVPNLRLLRRLQYEKERKEWETLPPFPKKRKTVNELMQFPETETERETIAAMIREEREGWKEGHCLPRDFIGWHYRRDATHVSFFTEDAIRILAESVGLKWIARASEHVYIFQKQSTNDDKE